MSTLRLPQAITMLKMLNRPTMQRNQQSMPPATSAGATNQPEATMSGLRPVAFLTGTLSWRL